MTKSTIDWMNAPYFTAAPPTMYSRPLKSIPPVRTHTRGMMISPTTDETILPKAVPMTTPTARSMTFPFIAKSRNSLNMDIEKKVKNKLVALYI